MHAAATAVRKKRFRSLGHRAPLLWVLVPILSGLSLGHAGLSLPSAWIVSGAAGFAAFALAAKYAKWPPGVSAFGLCAGLTLAGLAYYDVKRPRLADWDWLPPREAELTLRVTRTFSQSRADRASGLAVIESTAPHLRELIGQRIYFSLKLPESEAVAPPLLLRATRLEALGVLSALSRRPEPASFEHYLDSAGVNFRFSQGQILQVRQPASVYRHFCARAAERFSESLGQGIAAAHPETAGILRAMLLGQRSELSEEQSGLFRASGTMHVFAISGLHIGIIAAAIHWLLALLRLPHKLRLLVELSALWLYVDITGAAPSAVRAFIMVALFLLAFALRLPANPVATLTTSALIVVCLDPLQIFSASFQMSYGIVAALLLIGLPLAEHWQAAWQPYAMIPKATWSGRQHALDWLRRWGFGALGIGVAATLVSSVTGVLFFELFTPASLFINLLVIPAASCAIIAGFASLLCGLLHFTLGSLVANYVAFLVLAGTETLISAVMQVPHLWFYAAFRAPWVGSVTLVALLLILLIGYSQHWSRWCRFFWPPFAVLALGFALGVRFG
ncbi:hypothetical protein AXK11_08225 [Cephaloticoccus primus]|uniref:ComEC/Rec2-related protein domain-containing protein n=1 Tax=Cephaloticoccus primus TaxID=1548207 RepID=A0A139SJ06_9BACT|nr:ComEC/Rec2 family competence protein [Cephaloticoccus primus]KXU34501.1 hypothetical protein AXK11_08225 [Cephaloticoccus primus]